MWFGHTLVSNPEGVTVWDVRQAFLNSPVFVLSSSLPRLGRFFLRLRTRRGADFLILFYFIFGFGTDSLPLIITRMVSFFEESIPGSQKHGEFSCKFDASLFTLPFLSSSSFLPFLSFLFLSFFLPNPSTELIELRLSLSMDHRPPGHETDLLGRDGLEQEKKGSVRIGHYSLWVISAPPQPQEEEEE